MSNNESIAASTDVVRKGYISMGRLVLLLLLLFLIHVRGATTISSIRCKVR